MNRYNIIEQTGEQATGTIYFGENKETLEKVIIKKYKKKFYTWSDCMALREIKVLRTFNHLNIVKLKELIKENNVLYSIYEYMDQNLYDYYQTLRDSNTYLQETEIKSIMHQIFQALHYSHKNQFFHRDLSLENVFINHDTQQVKVSNFQAAREMNAKGQLTDYITTRWYRAPEQLLHSASYNYKIDCWAAACIMAELYLLGPLFPGNSESDQLFRIIKILGTPKDWPDFHNLMLNMTKNKGQTPVYDPQELAYIIPQASVEAIDLLKRLFIYNPQNRFSAAQALNHPYFTGISLQQYKMQLTNQNSFLSPSNSRSNQQHLGQNQEKSSKSQFNKQGKLNQAKDQDQVEEDPNEYLTSPTKKSKRSSVQEEKNQRNQNIISRFSENKNLNNNNNQEKDEKEDVASQNSSQNNVPLDIQQQQMQFKRPTSRDCNRNDRENQDLIKHQKEIGDEQDYPSLGDTKNIIFRIQKDQTVVNRQQNQNETQFNRINSQKSEEEEDDQENQEEPIGELKKNEEYLNNKSKEVNIKMEPTQDLHINFRKNHNQNLDQNEEGFVPIPKSKKSGQLTPQDLTEIRRKSQQYFVNMAEDIQIQKSNQPMDNYEEFKRRQQIENQQQQKQQQQNDQANYIPPKTPDNPPGLDLGRYNSLKNCLENKNVIVTAETGSGKSLCYIIPVMNKILNQQDKYNQIKQDINIPINNIQKGAIILAPTKELCAQIYAMIRALDKKNRIYIQRMGSIQQIAPIVSYLSSNEYSQEQLRQMSFQNVVNGVNWNNTDILVSTPSQLEQILQVKDKQDPFEVNPATIVIDEVDLLLGESTLSKSTMDILKRFSFAQNKIFGKENLERQFILAGATLPKKIKKHNTKDLFNLWFSQPYFIESENFHKIPPTIEFDNIDIDDFLAEYEDLTVQDLLVKEIQKSKSKKIIVFCDNYNTVQQIVDHLEQHKITSAPFYGSLSTEARMNILNDFHIGQFQVLVATELVSRGHCFEGVEHIIQFDFPKDAVSFLHRVGRTGRLGEKGKVTNFIREKDQFFFSKISQVLQNRVSIEQAFSRKRSLKKQAEKQEY